MGNWVPVQSIAQPVGGKATYQRRVGSREHALPGEGSRLLAALQGGPRAGRAKGTQGRGASRQFIHLMP